MLLPRYGWSMRQASALLLVPDSAFKEFAYLNVSRNGFVKTVGVIIDADYNAESSIPPQSSQEPL